MSKSTDRKVEDLKFWTKCTCNVGEQLSHEFNICIVSLFLITCESHIILRLTYCERDYAYARNIKYLLKIEVRSFPFFSFFFFNKYI